MEVSSLESLNSEKFSNVFIARYINIPCYSIILKERLDDFAARMLEMV